MMKMAFKVSAKDSVLPELKRSPWASVMKSIPINQRKRMLTSAMVFIFILRTSRLTGAVRTPSAAAFQRTCQGVFLSTSTVESLNFPGSITHFRRRTPFLAHSALN